MTKLDFVFFDAGGGHRSAANALRDIIARQGRPWEIRMVNLQELLDPLDIFRKITGLRLEDVYNTALKKGWTLGSPQLTAAMHVLIRLYHSKQVRLLAKFWADRDTGLVVSVVPNFNRALRESIPGRKFATIITDIADYPPHFWIERQRQYLICGSERAVEQAREHGYPEECIFRTSGMIIHPRFYDAPEVDRAAERKRLGLDPGLPTGLVLFGGAGSANMARIARRLDASGLRLQLIFVCGKNEKLAAGIRSLPHRIPWFVEGFTKEIPYYMQLSDFFIGKPGPGSISEALAMKLPVIVSRNAWTLPQERYNADWIVEKQVGVVLKDFKYVDRAVDELLRPETHRRFRANAAALNNRAVFEIPEILETILKSSCVSCG